jgi:hypothetical protein
VGIKNDLVCDNFFTFFIQSSSSFIGIAIDPYFYFQSRFCGSGFIDLFDNLNTREDDSLTGSAHMTKESVFYEIVLGGIWGIMSNPYLFSYFVGKLL